MRGSDQGFDFAAYDERGRPTVQVEVKCRLSTDASWATDFRSRMYKYGRKPFAELFMLVVPNRLYIWQAAEPPDAPPTHEVDARPLFAPYFERVGLSPQQIEPMAFELLVSWWLRDLARSAGESVAPGLVGSGLAEAISGADITHQAAL